MIVVAHALSSVIRQVDSKAPVYQNYCALRTLNFTSELLLSEVYPVITAPQCENQQCIGCPTPVSPVCVIHV